MKKAAKKLLVLLFALSMALPVSAVTAWADAAPGYDDFQSENFDVVVQDKDGDGYIYLRYGPGTGYGIITTINDGVVLHISASAYDAASNERWGQTKYNGQYGWVALPYTVAYSGSASAPSNSQSEVAVSYDVAVYATDGTDYLYLRAGPSMNYDILKTIYNGQKLHISAQCTDPSGSFTWGKTQYDGSTGWVSLLHVMDYDQYQNTYGAPEPTKEPVKTEAPTPSATPTPTPSATPTPTATVTETPTATPTQTVEPKKTETPTVTQTPEATETAEPQEEEKGNFFENLKGKLSDEESEEKTDTEKEEVKKKKSKKDKDEDKDDEEDEKDQKKSKKSESGSFIQDHLMIVVLIAIAAVLAAVVILLLILLKKKK